MSIKLNPFTGQFDLVNPSGGGGSGDVVGPASATDNALVRFDGATGKLIQNSAAILTDAGAVSGLTGLSSSGTINFSSLTASRVPYIDASSNLIVSAVTPTELGYLSGVTSAIQTQINDINSNLTENAQDAVGAMVGVSLIYVDGTPLLARAALTGDITAAQDSNATTLATVNANVGAFGSATQVATFTVNAKGLITAAANVSIAITSAAVTDFNEAAQDAIGGILTDSSRVDFTYNDVANTITADLIADSVDNTFLANMAQATMKGRASGAGTGDPTDLSAAQVVTIINASLDHGTMAGLGDDDHTQYALLLGRSAGQILIGGTASGDDLTLQSTSNATKGDVFISDGSINHHVFGVTAGGESCFNDAGIDLNFRVESDSDENMFFVDGGANAIGIGTNAPSARLEVTKDWPSSVSTNLIYSGTSYGDFTRFLFRRGNGTSAAPTQVLSAEPLAVLGFRGYHSGGAFSSVNIAGITVFSKENFTSTAQGAYMNFAYTPTGTASSVEALRIDSTVVFNDTGADQDLRIEGDTNQNLVYVDASTDRVGIGGTPNTSVSTVSLHVKAGHLLLDNNQQIRAIDAAGTGSFGLFFLNATDDVIFNCGTGQQMFFTEGGTTRIFIDGATGNMMLGSGAFGTSAVRTFALQNGTAPTTAPADLVQLWAQDTVAGQANIYVKNENGKSEQISGLADRVSSDFAVTSSTTLTNITGLSHNVEAGKAYAFEAKLYTTSNIAGGVKASIAGTATATTIVYEGTTFSAGTVTQTRATALATAVGAITAVTAAFVEINGTILVNGAGTLTVQFAQNASSASASTVLTNSTFILRPIGD